MRETLATARVIAFAIVAGITAASTQAQETTPPDAKPATTAGAETPAAPAAPPASEPLQAAESAPPPPPPAATPVVAAVREKLSAPASGAQSGQDALAAFYATYAGEPVWAQPSGLTDKGKALAAEIRRADDWGLKASVFDLPTLAEGESESAAADAEIRLGLAALAYARQAKGGRLDPTSISAYVDRKPNLPDPVALYREMTTATDPAALLRAQHPKHPQFELLRQALLTSRGSAPQPEDEALLIEIPPGPLVKVGADHPHVVLLRRRLKVRPSEGVPETTLDPPLVGAVRAFQAEKGLKTTGSLNGATRNALNQRNKPARSSDTQRLVLNMERWRWMPDDLGRFHVWDNIPDFTTSVIKDGKVVHSERIIVGKVNTQTPIFSADMKTIVFHPEWGVPDSIKIKELQPYLRPSQDFFGWGQTDTRILERQNLRVNYNGRPVDPRQVNWQNVDIRRFSFIQSPGAHNVLGVVKFMFPNKHDVYMHDTPQRNLFANDTRTFSHGCVRVRDPLKFAEVILGEDQGWGRAEVEAMVDGGATAEVKLKTRIPVHINYFTAVAGADGTVQHHRDVYGQDARLAAALEGRFSPPETSGGGDDDAPLRVARAKQKKYQPINSIDDMFSGLFGN